MGIYLSFDKRDNCVPKDFFETIHKIIGINPDMFWKRAEKAFMRYVIRDAKKLTHGTLFRLRRNKTIHSGITNLIENLLFDHRH